MKILLIEDDEVFRSLTAAVLEKEGHLVRTAVDGAEGLRLAAEEHFDAVVLDLMMPGMHGYEVIQCLRSAPATVRVPIVVSSAKIYESDRRRAFSLGADRFVQKPVDPEKLVSVVSEIFNCVRVTFWGTRGSIAAAGPDTVRYGGNTPCISLHYQGRDLILDAGTGIRKLGIILQGEARGEPLDVDLLVTHTHWDHIQGFPFFVPAYVPGNTVRVYGPRSPSKPLDRVLHGQMDPEYFPVALGDMAGSVQVSDLREAPLTLGPYTIDFTFMNHPGITLGYRIQVAGLTITYATDTEPFGRLLEGNGPVDDTTAQLGARCDRGLVEIARNADLYIGDAQYTPEEYAEKVGWGHSSCTDAVAVAIEAGAKRLVLFSHDPMQNDDAVDAKLVRCRELAAERGSSLEIVAAVEGHTILLPTQPNPEESTD